MPVNGGQGPRIGLGMQSTKLEISRRSHHREEKIMSRLIIFLVVSSLLFNGTSALAQSGGGETSIVGTAASDEGPIEGLSVSLLRAADDDYISIANASTGPMGRYAFENLTSGGDYMLKLRYGDVDHYKTFMVESEVVEADFNLTGIIVYEVVDTEGEPVQDLEMELISRLGYIITTSSTDEAGAGSFSPLDLEESYMVFFYHLGIPYSIIVSFENATTSHADFQLLASTTSDEEMEIYVHHVIAEIDVDGVSVWEGITYQNAGDEIFNNSWLRILVHPNAEEFASDVMDCCVQNTEEGVIIDPMEPIFPGDRFETTLTYKLKVKSANMALERKIDYDTGTLYFFVKKAAGVGAEAVSEMTFDGERSLGGEDYLVFKGSELRKDGMASLKLTGLMSTTEVLLNSPLVWVAALLVPPVGLLIYFLRFRRDGEPELAVGPPVEPESTAVEEDDRRQRVEEGTLLEEPATPEELTDLRAEEKAFESILEKIASDFEGGQLTEGVYRSLIARYEERLDRVRARLQLSSPDETETSED